MWNRTSLLSLRIRSGRGAGAASPRRDPLSCEMDLGRCAISQALMGTLLVIEPKVLAKSGVQLWHRLVISQVDVFILDGPPKSFDKDVVQGATPPIHTDPHARHFERVGKRMRRELHALIRVKDGWLALTQSVLQGVQTELSIQGVRELPGQHVATE